MQEQDCREGEVRYCVLFSACWVCIMIIRWNLLAVVLLVLVVGCGEKALTEKSRTYPDGKVAETWFEDRDGFKKGVKKTFYPSGQLQTEAMFESGYLHGEMVMFDPNGNELARGAYRDGEKWSGTFAVGDEATMRLVIEEYKDGQRVD